MFWSNLFTSNTLTPQDLWSTLLNPPSNSHDIPWTYFLRTSSYSPYQLSNLRPPRPSDLPSDASPDDVTFHTALQDLLAVSSGQDLPPITTHISTNRLLRGIFPQGEPISFFIQRLNATNLLTPNTRKFLLPDNLAGATPSNLEEFRGAFEAAAKDLIPSDEELNKAANAIADLTDVWTTAVDTGAKSFDSFVNLITDGSSKNVQTDLNSRNHSSWDVTASFPKSKGKVETVEDKDEYIDWMGMLHTKHTTKTVDSEGRVLSSRSSWSVTSNYDKEKYKNVEKKGRDEPKDW